MKNVSLIRIVLLGLMLNLGVLDVQAMNFKWLYNTPAKKVILGGTALVGVGAAAYYFYNNSGNTVNTSNQVENEEEETFEEKTRKIKKKLESLKKIESVKERTKELIALLNETKKTTVTEKAHALSKSTNIICMYRDPRSYIFEETVSSLCNFALTCDKLDEIKEFLFQIHEESRKPIINASYGDKRNTLMHVIFKKYSDEVNEYDELVKELKKDNITENMIDFDETEKTIKEYETLIQLLIQMDGSIGEKNEEKVTPYDVLVGTAKNKVHKILQIIAANYVIGNDHEKLRCFLVGLHNYFSPEGLAKIINENNAMIILTALNGNIEAKALLLLIECGIKTNTQNANKKSITDYFIEKNLKELPYGYPCLIIKNALQNNDAGLFDYGLPYLKKSCMSEVNTHSFQKVDLLTTACLSEQRLYLQKLIETDLFDEEQRLEALQEWLHSSKKPTLDWFISINSLLKIDLKKHINDLLKVTSDYIEWNIIKYLLGFIDNIEDIRCITKTNLITKNCVNSLINQSFIRWQKEYQWLLHSHSFDDKVFLFLLNKSGRKDTDIFDEDQRLEALKTWFNKSEKSTLNGFISVNSLLKVDIKKYFNELLNAIDNRTEWEVAKHLLNHVDTIKNINNKARISLVAGYYGNKGLDENLAAITLKENYAWLLHCHAFEDTCLFYFLYKIGQENDENWQTSEKLESLINQFIPCEHSSRILQETEDIKMEEKKIPTFEEARLYEMYKKSTETMKPEDLSHVSIKSPTNKTFKMVQSIKKNSDLNGLFETIKAYKKEHVHQKIDGTKLKTEITYKIDVYPIKNDETIYKIHSNLKEQLKDSDMQLSIVRKDTYI